MPFGALEAGRIGRVHGAEEGLEDRATISCTTHTRPQSRLCISDRHRSREADEAPEPPFGVAFSSSSCTPSRNAPRRCRCQWSKGWHCASGIGAGARQASPVSAGTAAGGLPKSPSGGAVRYALNQWEAITRFSRYYGGGAQACAHCVPYALNARDIRRGHPEKNEQHFRARAEARLRAQATALDFSVVAVTA